MGGVYCELIQVDGITNDGRRGIRTSIFQTFMLAADRSGARLKECRAIQCKSRRRSQL